MPAGLVLTVMGKVFPQLTVMVIGPVRAPIMTVVLLALVVKTWFAAPVWLTVIVEPAGALTVSVLLLPKMRGFEEICPEAGPTETPLQPPLSVTT